MEKTHLSKAVVDEVHSFCYNMIVPDKKFINGNRELNKGFKKDKVYLWFYNYFNFLKDEKLQKYLADSYFQARLIYKMGLALNFQGVELEFVHKFQVVQYASIYEALIDYSLQKYYSESADYIKKTTFSEYVPGGYLAKNVEITIDLNKDSQNVLFVCKKKIHTLNLYQVKFEDRVDMAINFGLISELSGEVLNKIYTLRNNIHLLKASDANYNPSIVSSLTAFTKMRKVVSEVRRKIEKLEKINRK